MRIVKKFSQGSDFNIYTLTNTKAGGVCLALSTFYLVERLHGRDFWRWLDTGANIKKLLKLYDRGPGVSDKAYVDNVQRVLDNELTRVGTLERVPFANYPRFALYTLGGQDEIHVDGPGRLVALEWGVGFFGAGHAIAITIEPDVRLFDPNYGEFEFRGGQEELARFLSPFLNRRYNLSNLRGRARVDYVRSR